jgi:hypothetical protein
MRLRKLPGNLTDYGGKTQQPTRPGEAMGQYFVSTDVIKTCSGHGKKEQVKILGSVRRSARTSGERTVASA